MNNARTLETLFQLKIKHYKVCTFCGSARHAIEGLSHSVGCYAETIKSLKTSYDSPHLIHQTCAHLYDFKRTQCKGLYLERAS